MFQSHIISISSSSSSLMEFKYSLQSQMGMKEEKKSDLDDDDDVFYAELRRQILLLTDDNDDDYEDNGDIPENKHLKSASGAKQGSGFCCSAVLLPGSYFSWLENEEINTVPPTWLVNLWRQGNGTGVFIPHIIKSRRRRKQRSNNDKGRIYKPMPNKNE